MLYSFFLVHFFGLRQTNIFIFLKIMMLFYMLCVYHNDGKRRICQVSRYSFHFIWIFFASFLSVRFAVCNKWARSVEIFRMSCCYWESWKVYWNCIPFFRFLVVVALFEWVLDFFLCVFFIPRTVFICYLSQEFKIRIFLSELVFLSVLFFCDKDIKRNHVDWNHHS